MYDLIGDIHGHAAELAELLRRMGYARRDGAWRHPERLAVFVGDFLDRGPEIRETLRLVREMLESGSARAVLGNHEWNAFAFHSPDPDLPGEFLRRHVERNVQQVAATLAQVPAAELASHLDFLRALPIALELRSPGGAGDLRVVHACWDEVAFEVIEEALARHGGLADPFLIEGSNPQSLLFAALEIVLKGKEIALPAGDSLVDKDGNVRHLARVRWYAPTAGQSISSYTLPHFPHLSPAPLPAKVVAEARPYPEAAPPVFFGHYWLADPVPAALAPNVFCLDYSVAAGGFLCGYRCGGEQNGTFVTVPSRRRSGTRSS